MLKVLKLKKEMLELSNDKDDIFKYSLEICSMILGYFARKKDCTLNSLYDCNDILIKIENRIKKLLNTNYKILGIRDNSKDSFMIFISNYTNSYNNEISDIVKQNFIDGYNYYDFYHSKYSSVLDYLLLHKHQRLEYKLKNFII